MKVADGVAKHHTMVRRLASSRKAFGAVLEAYLGGAVTTSRVSTQRWTMGVSAKAASDLEVEGCVLLVLFWW